MKNPIGNIFSRSAERQFSSVPSTVLMYMAWKNLSTKKLRSFLTVLGVIIGIGAIFFLLSFGLGLQNLVTQQVIGDQSIKSVDISSPNSRIIKLDEDAVNRISKFSHIDKVGTLFSFPGTFKSRGGEVDTVVYGINKNYGDIASLNIKQGRNLKDEDKDAVVINLSVLKALGINDQNKAIDQKIELLIPLTTAGTQQKEIKSNFTIVGVIDSGSGSEVYVPGHIFQAVGVKAFSQVKIVADDTNNIPSLRKQIEGSGFQTVSPIDTLDQINQIFKFFNIILVSFGAIGMIVSILGMFNTLTISLLERTKEIGLMIALGGRHKDMRKLFTFEAMLLSLIGAVAGIILAVTMGQFVNILMNNLAEQRGVNESFDLFSTPLWLMGAMILFMLIVGMIVVFIPARRAERINPIDALRRE